MATVPHALVERFRIGVQIDDGAAFGEPSAVRLADHRAASGSQHDVLEQHQVGDHRLLAVAKRDLALDLEDRGDRHAQASLELMVGIDVALAQAARELPPERRLARAHETDEIEVAAMQLHPRIVANGTRRAGRGAREAARGGCRAGEPGAAIRQDRAATAAGRRRRAAT